MNIKTDRLIIRDYTEDDFDDYYHYIMDKELQKMLGVEYINDINSAYENFTWLMENREFLAIELKETNKVIGHIAIHPPYEALNSFEEYKNKRGASLSFALNTNNHRKGYMTESLNSVIYFLFNERKLEYLDCEYEDFNLASMELQKKLGFQYIFKEIFDDFTLYINILKNPN